MRCKSRARSLTTIGVLRMRAHVIERRGQSLVAGLFAENDFDQHHAVDRREEMDADEAGRDRLNSEASEEIGKVEVLEAKIAFVPDDAPEFLRSPRT